MSDTPYHIDDAPHRVAVAKEPPEDRRTCRSAESHLVSGEGVWPLGGGGGAPTFVDELRRRVGGRSPSGLPQAPDIALKPSAKQAAILAAELRGALIAHSTCGAARVEALVQHQWPCFLAPQLFLELQRAHAGDGAVMLGRCRSWWS